MGIVSHMLRSESTVSATPPAGPRTLSQKVWDRHLVRHVDGEPDLLFIDLHLVHEVTSPQAFEAIELTGRRVRHPELTVAIEDHNIPTKDIDQPIADPVSAKQIETLRTNAAANGITIFPMGHANNGIGYIAEYRGAAIEALSMEGRMTVCNMSIEGGAKAGLIAPDQVTFDYVEGRPYAPSGDAWTAALADWATLRTDQDATFDHEERFDAAEIEPHISWGTNPGQVVPLSSRVPAPDQFDDPTERNAAE